MVEVFHLPDQEPERSIDLLYEFHNGDQFLSGADCSGIQNQNPDSRGEPSCMGDWTHFLCHITFRHFARLDTNQILIEKALIQCQILDYLVIRNFNRGVHWKEVDWSIFIIVNICCFANWSRILFWVSSFTINFQNYMTQW